MPTRQSFESNDSKGISISTHSLVRASSNYGRDTKRTQRNSSCSNPAITHRTTPARRNTSRDHHGVALQIERPFSDYVFIELNKERVKQLKQLALEAGKNGPKVHVRQRDCNEYLTEFLHESRGRWRNWRGVIFLDPFGMQVPWSTIAEIGKTGAIEVFINFPVGMAIQRLLKKNGLFSSERACQARQLFWDGRVVRPLVPEEERPLRRRGGGQVAGRGRSARQMVPGEAERRIRARDHRQGGSVQSTTGRPLYYLIFAGPHKKGAEIADHVLQQGARRIR